jgi:hypothetical protein
MIKPLAAENQNGHTVKAAELSRNGASATASGTGSGASQPAEKFLLGQESKCIHTKDRDPLGIFLGIQILDFLQFPGRPSSRRHRRTTGKSAVRWLQ